MDVQDMDVHVGSPPVYAELWHAGLDAEDTDIEDSDTEDSDTEDDGAGGCSVCGDCAVQMGNTLEAVRELAPLCRSQSQLADEAVKAVELKLDAMLQALLWLKCLLGAGICALVLSLAVQTFCGGGGSRKPLAV